MLGEYARNDGALDVAGNAQLTVYTSLSLGGCLQLVVGNLQLTVCIFQLLVGCCKTMGCLPLVQRIDEEEYNEQNQCNTCRNQSLLREVGLLAGNLCFLSLCVVDGCQFGCPAVLLGRNSTIQNRQDADTCCYC